MKDMHIYQTNGIQTKVVLHAALVAALSFSPGMVAAQTDYYNTDAGRPIRVEDATALERRGFELQAAPLRLERGRGGIYRWGIEPEIAYGILPRTQFEVGFPLVFVDAGANGQRTTGLAGIDVSVLHNFNTETRLPAFAIAAEVFHLAHQPRDAWSFLAEVRPFHEPW